MSSGVAYSASLWLNPLSQGTKTIAAGATLAKPAGKTFWGGYSGYFKDPDGHLWEVAHNPFFWIGPEDDPRD